MRIFKNKKQENSQEAKQVIKKRRWPRFLLFVFLIFFVTIFSYTAYLVASGKNIFDVASISSSPFFNKMSGKEYTLRGEGDGRINILVLGMGGSSHPGGTLTDSIMVASIDPENKTLAMLSIPRDLWVTIPNTKQSLKINQVYSTGEGDEKGSGARLAKETVGKILDLPIHYYLTLDFYGFKKFIDGIGGIDVNVPKAIYDPYYPDQNMKGYEPFYIKAGNQHLSGETALKYARSRETSSDFDRAERQQIIITATKEKAMSKGMLTNPKTILDLVNIVGEHVKTDLSADELYGLAKIATDLDGSKTVSKVLTNGPGGELVADNSRGTYSLVPAGGNYTNIQRLAHEIFTDPELTSENAKIELLNGTTKVGLASTLAESLSSYNYNVIKIANTPEKYLKTIIYDYSSGTKKTTLSFLKSRLGAIIISKDRPDNTSADISVVIGENYQGFQRE